MERKLALRARVPPTQVFGGLGQKPLLDLANDLGNQIAAPDDRALIQRKLSYSLLMATLYMPSVLVETCKHRRPNLQTWRFSAQIN